MDYKYKAGPTGTKFLASRKYIKVIGGPIGCLPADSEFLTPYGWKRMDAYEPGDRVAVWQAGVVKFEPATHVCLPATEEFIRFDSGSLVMELSPEHRVPHWNWAGEFQVKTAQEIAARPSKRTIPTTFSVPATTHPVLTDDQIRLRVMVSADGYISPAGGQIKVTVRKPRKLERALALLSRLGISYSLRTVDRDGSAEHSITFHAPRVDKSLGFVYGLSSRQLNVVVEEAMHWDGLHDHAEMRFFTTIKANADAVQFAAHASGKRATVRVRQDERNMDWAPLYTVFVRTKDNPKNRAQVRCDTTSITRFESPDGKKYCFTTSTGFFVARCEGTVFITGNSGKSTVCLFDLFKRAIEQAPFQGVRRTKFVILRNTVAQLKSTVKPLIDQWFVTLTGGKWGQWRLTDNVFELRFNLPDGTRVDSEFWLMAADTPEDVRRLLSLEASAAWCEEWREIDPEVFSGLQGRVARFPNRASGGVTYPGVICSTNPPPIGSWHQQLMADPPDNTDVFMQPPALLEDGSVNPETENLENLDPAYYDNLIAGKTDDWIDVYLKNKFGSGGFGQPVFKSTFREAFHVAKEPLKLIPASNNPVIVGMDNGLTAAAVIGQMDARGRVNIVDEAYVPEGQSMGVETFLDRLLIPKLLALGVPTSHVRFVLDPACFQRAQLNEITIAMGVQSRGFSPIRASTNDPVRRIQAVEGLLLRAIDGGPGMLISPTCGWLIQAMSWGYRNKRMSSGQQTATPEKNHHSHVCFAAGTMVATPRGEVPIETLLVGDEVLTPLGPRRLLATKRTDDVEVIEARFANGRSFVSTQDHPVFVDGVGFVRADELQYQDKLVFVEDSCRQGSIQSRNLTESSTTASRAGTTRPTTQWVGDTFTGSSTKSTMGLFQGGTRFTTLTTTGRTTLLKIWSRLRDACISGITYCTDVARIQFYLIATLLRLVKLQVGGTAPMLVGSGTGSTQNGFGGLQFAPSSSVRTAEKHSKRFDKRSSEGFAARPAKEWPARNPVKTTWIEPVAVAVASSGSGSTARLRTAPGRVKRSSVIARTAVYALQVEQCPMFFASGVLVSNCDALQYFCLHYNLQVHPAADQFRSKPRTVVPRAYAYV